jgi:glycosyltransferase involved in cell wall biosynthesis
MTYVPEISVVMPVFNAAPFIREAIDSILHQTFTRFELIIVDDGSSDDSVSIVESYSDTRLRLLKQEHSGIAEALNRGIAVARAPLIARFDADDVCYPSRLLVQFEFLNCNKDVGIVGSAAHYVDSEGLPAFTYCPPGQTNEQIQLTKQRICPFIHSSILIRKSLLLKHSYSPEALTFEDHFLWLQVLRYARGFNLSQPLLKVRLNPASVTIDDRWRPKRFHELKNKLLLTGTITPEEATELRSIVDKQRTSETNAGAYHSLLAKKYLWDNYQPSLARKHLRLLSQSSAMTLQSYLLYGASFIPGKVLKAVYRLKQKNTYGLSPSQ